MIHVGINYYSCKRYSLGIFLVRVFKMHVTVHFEIVYDIGYMGTLV